MEFRILGPLQVDAGSGLVRVAGRRTPKLLAVLLVNHGHVVSLEHLIDAVWDDDPPATAKRQIQNCVSLVRRQFAGGGTDPIEVTDGTGYRIRVADGELDARLFEQRCAAARRAVARGELAPAAGEFRSALRLWRGPALAGLGGPVIEAAAARLEEQRIAAVEECVDLELGLGRERALVGELTGLVAAHPLRERLVGQLMLALYRSDRQAEALQAYHRSRRLLAEELGLDPGARLRELYTKILAGAVEPAAAGVPAGAADPPPAGPAAAPVRPGPAWPVPAQLPADLVTFTGRADHLKELDALAQRGAGGGTAVVISAISGMAGIGKTALAVHWAHRAADRFPDGQLYVNLRGYDPGGQVMSPAEAVRGFLDALGVPADRIPPGLDAQAALYRSMLAGKRILVLLDNARGAEQVRPLLPGTATALALVTSRSQLTPLVAADGAHPLTLDVLSTAEARDLLTHRLGPERVAAEPDAVRAISVACGRLPLALSIAAARAQETDFPLASLATDLGTAGERLDALDGGDAASQVRAVFSWSYTALTPPAAGLFRLLGLHPGPEISVAAAGSLAGRSPAQTRRLLSELTRANLLTERTRGRYTCHDLLRAYATDLAHAQDSGDQRRAALTRLLGYHTHSAHAAARLLTPQRDAMPLPLDPAVPGAGPDRFAGHPEAMAWLIAERQVLLVCLRHAADTGFDTQAWQLAWALDTFLDWRGHWHDSTAAWRIALPAAGRLANLPARAYAHRRLALASMRLGRHADAHEHHRRALELYGRTGNRVGQADTRYDLAHLRWRQGHQRQALKHSELALDLYQAAGHPQGRARALNAVGWCHAHLGNHAEALAHCQQALTVLQQLDDRYGIPHTLDSLGFAHHRLRQHAEAADCYQRAIGRYRELGDRYGEATTLTRLGDTRHAAGEATAAADAWQRALAIFDDLGHPDADPVRANLRGLDAETARG